MTSILVEMIGWLKAIKWRTKGIEEQEVTTWKEEHKTKNSLFMLINMWGG